MAATPSKAKRRAEGHILLIEDEPALLRGIRRNLEAEGYRVDSYPSADEALEKIEAQPQVGAAYSLGIFDISLPGKLDGLAFCSEIRRRSIDFPVIFLSARNRLEDKLAGFESGADDYLTKPFDLEELLARVSVRINSAIAQRKSRSEAASSTNFLFRERPETNESGQALPRIGEWQINIEAGVARHTVSGQEQRFNERETKILALLLARRGKPVRRDEILDEVWGADFPSNRTIDNFMVKFRKIFEQNPAQPVHFITRHGTGYELT